MTPAPTATGWNLIFASVAGTAHRGGVCQDHADGRIIATRDGPVLIAAVADGAGSASDSDQGAREAVATFLDRAEAAAVTTPVAAITAEEVRGWVEAARAQVERTAEARGVPLRQLACTLLAAVVGAASAWFAQIGDGVIVFHGPDADHAFAFWPDTGEYANTTRFLTDGDFATRLRVDRLDGSIEALAILTDGLQMLALDYAAGQVHGRFFAPLFAVVAGPAAPDALRGSLLGFLDSPRINARTDDDKTLLLATRRPPAPARPDDPGDADGSPDPAA